MRSYGFLHVVDDAHIQFKESHPDQIREVKREKTQGRMGSSSEDEGDAMDDDDGDDDDDDDW